MSIAYEQTSAVKLEKAVHWNWEHLQFRPRARLSLLAGEVLARGKVVLHTIHFYRFCLLLGADKIETGRIQLFVSGWI